MMKSFFVVAATAALLLVGCEKQERDPVSTAPAAVPAPADPPPPEKQVVDFQTVDQVFDFLGDQLGDAREKAGNGTLLLAVWSSKRLHWQDLAARQQSTRALVMKNSQKERSKALCTTGRLIEIESHILDGEEFSEAGLIDENMGIYRLVGVGDTGDLVEGRLARFCGLVVGRFDYSNSGGGVTHAVQLVGMYDLPKNRQR